MVSIHDEDSLGHPACWNWKLSQIRDYVKDRCRTFIALPRKGRKAIKKQVREVEDLILFCLDKKTVYAHDKDKSADSSNLNRCLYASLYGCTYYPITDVFTALGWFVTVTDARSVEGIDNIIHEQFKTIVLFSRLLYNVSVELDIIDLCPIIAHSSLPVAYNIPGVDPWIDPINMSTAKTITNVCLSSSLPGPTTNVNAEKILLDSRAKGEALQKRLFALKSVCEAFRPQDFESYQYKVGFCAETLNGFSAACFQAQAIRQGRLRKHPNHKFVLGAAVRVKAMNQKFKDYDNCLQRGITVPPCDSCLRLFAMLSIEYVDIRKLVIRGELSANIIADFRATVKCNCCDVSCALDYCPKCDVSSAKHLESTLGDDRQFPEALRSYHNLPRGEERGSASSTTEQSWSPASISLSAPVLTPTFSVYEDPHAALKSPSAPYQTQGQAMYSASSAPPLGSLEDIVNNTMLYYRQTQEAMALRQTREAIALLLQAQRNVMEQAAANVSYLEHLLAVTQAGLPPVIGVPSEGVGRISPAAGFPNGDDMLMPSPSPLLQTRIHDLLSRNAV